MSESDGGPGFPDDRSRVGMSLRDYFAAQAQSHLNVKFYAKVYQRRKKEPNIVEIPPFEWGEDTIKAVARWEAAYAYCVADAMLAERAKDRS